MEEWRVSGLASSVLPPTEESMMLSRKLERQALCPAPAKLPRRERRPHKKVRGQNLTSHFVGLARNHHTMR